MPVSGTVKDFRYNYEFDGTTLTFIEDMIWLKSKTPFSSMNCDGQNLAAIVRYNYYTDDQYNPKFNVYQVPGFYEYNGITYSQKNEEFTYGNNVEEYKHLNAFTNSTKTDSNHTVDGQYYFRIVPYTEAISGGSNFNILIDIWKYNANTDQYEIINRIVKFITFFSEPEAHYYDTISNKITQNGRVMLVAVGAHFFVFDLATFEKFTGGGGSGPGEKEFTIPVYPDWTPYNKSLENSVKYFEKEKITNTYPYNYKADENNLPKIDGSDLCEPCPNEDNINTTNIFTTTFLKVYQHDLLPEKFKTESTCTPFTLDNNDTEIVNIYEKKKPVSKVKLKEIDKSNICCGDNDASST